MIVNLMRRMGDSVVVEQIDSPVIFEGGQPQEGVLTTFALDGREVTGRIVKVEPHDLDGEPVIEVELVDTAALDVQSEITLSRLPPKDLHDRDLTRQPLVHLLMRRSRRKRPGRASCIRSPPNLGLAMVAGSFF